MHNDLAPAFTGYGPPAGVDAAELKLLDDFQHDFPLMPHPYQHIASSLGKDWTEARVINTLQQGKASGKISRVGVVWAPNRIGVSTLAAISVAPTYLEEAAHVINQFEAVNHNYARHHVYNLWFVVAATDTLTLARILQMIEAETASFRRKPLLNLPLLTEYHIDLGFSLVGPGRKRSLPVVQAIEPVSLTARQWQLVQLLQEGIPLSATPYTDLAAQWGATGHDVIMQLKQWLVEGIIRRLGVVLHHRGLGYKSNAMCVWQIPEDRINEIGTQLAQEDCVRLCYRRPACGTEWPYTLFAMIHGKDETTVRQQLADINVRLGLTGYPSDVLFSTKRYKQCGARYARY
ncbi:siroheme decarboxylase subunit beta [Leeia oryzae]|uniref:siroheme decarboxylase subunit beta n=1 Tax=Leeia oryzae TaxID=356662 RepID=UPI00037BB1EF|nr:Lrp/AsnC family transcriptional regulator [Leeia oryzae]